MDLIQYLLSKIREKEIQLILSIYSRRELWSRILDFQLKATNKTLSHYFLFPSFRPK